MTKLETATRRQVIDLIRSRDFSKICQPRGELENRIRVTQERLSELKIRYTDRHPEVIATRQALDELVQRALGECVERLQ